MANKKSSFSLSDVYKKENRRRRRVILGVIVFLIYGVFLGGAWLVVRSPLFRIQKIEVGGNQMVSGGDILALVNRRMSDGSFLKRLLGAKNILAWPETLSLDDLKFNPELKGLSIKKDYKKRSVVVTVEERRPFGAWCLMKPQINADETLINADASNGNISENLRSNLRESASSCWWFDDSGTLFAKAMHVEGNLIAVVDDYSQKNLGSGSNILPGEFIPNIFSIFKVISGGELSVKEIRLNDINLQEIEVDTYAGLPAGALAKEGLKLYFSLRFPADNTLAVIQSLKNQSGFDKFQYLDFRVENRAYYK
ncbi:MAG: hypothetical protein HY433_03010 [Candidatus Liptonbacteria bacterium]|nr:hypothetical protein [Candidatus Liptonbacteria bacterium]